MARTLLEKYEAALVALKLWDEQHQLLLQERDTLLAQLQQCENDLKGNIRLERSSLEGRLVNAQYQTVRHRWYDVDTIKRLVPASLLEALNVIKISYEVDEKALKALVSAGKIPEATLVEAYREEQTGERVILKRKDASADKE